MSEFESVRTHPAYRRKIDMICRKTLRRFKIFLLFLLGVVVCYLMLNIDVNVNINNTALMAERFNKLITPVGYQLIQVAGEEPEQGVDEGSVLKQVVGAGSELQQLADAYAIKHSVDTKLFRALIQQESLWDPNAVSHVGAAGLTQLMPATAADECGLTSDDRFDPDKNLNCGAYYLSKQLERFGSVELALAAYNSGPERVARLWRIPRIKETQNYVSRIMSNWNDGV